MISFTDCRLRAIPARTSRDLRHGGAQDFTPWLLKKPDVPLRGRWLDLNFFAAEDSVGGLDLDLVGHDLTNDCVLIAESQLTTTDHNHLGQLVTYAGGTDAKTIVWISPSFRNEHRQAIDFRNVLGGEETRVLGVEISIVRLGTRPRHRWPVA